MSLTFHSKVHAYLCQVKRAKVDLTSNILQENPTFRNQQRTIGPSRDAHFEAMVST